MPPTRPLIAVFGSSTLEPDAPDCRLARDLGRRLARAGARVASGGYGGIMGAVSEGAREAGGTVVGVTLGTFTDREPNRWLTDEIPAPDLYSRLRSLTEAPDGYVVAAGNLGTLTELFLTWNLAMLRLLPPRPIVLLGGRWRALTRFLEESDLVPAEHLALLTVTESVDETLEALLLSDTAP